MHTSLPRTRARLAAAGLLDAWKSALRIADIDALEQMLRAIAFDDAAIVRTLARALPDVDGPIDAIVRARFSPDVHDGALALVKMSAHGKRVVKCAVWAANGDLEKLVENLALADVDPRDVIMMGEYVRVGTLVARVRSFSDE